MVQMVYRIYSDTAIPCGLVWKTNLDYLISTRVSIQWHLPSEANAAMASSASTTFIFSDGQIKKIAASF
jgi:hypothetical protein